MKASQSKKGRGAASPRHAVPARYLARRAYREALDEVEDFLGFSFFRLRELLADLAVEGSHRAWAERLGPLPMLDEIDYAQSDDPVVRDLAALHARLREVFDRLPPTSGAAPRGLGALH